MKRLVVFVAMLCFFWSGFFPLFAETGLAIHQASAAQLDRPSVMVTAELFAEAAEKTLRQELEAVGETRRYEIQSVRLPSDMRCPVGDLQVETKLTAPLRYGVTVPVTVMVSVNGSLYRRVVCYYVVHVYDTVAVASHGLPLNKAITASDIRFEERQIPSREEVYIKDSKSILGRVPTRVIREGTLLTEKMFQNPIVIEAGSPVKILANVNGIKIETEGVALQRGRLGARIRVRNATSSKILQGIVVDANTVEVMK